MRRFISLFTTIALAAGMAAGISIFAIPEKASGADEEPFSQGSLYKGSGPHPEARDTSGYSQVVEGEISGRLAGLWKRLGAEVFEPEVPKDGMYSLYARWPSGSDTEGGTRFGVETGDGMEWEQVRLQDNEDDWIEIGTYELEAGERRVIQRSRLRPGNRAGIAEELKVVGQEADPVGLVSDEPTAEGGYQFSTATQTTKRRMAMKRARNHLGTTYRLSPPNPCRAFKMEDCSCFTKLVFNKWRKLPDHPVKQWRYGRRVWKKSNLRPGDLVFFKENGRNKPITHVGIYSGRGNLVHASSYFGEVVESKMRYIDGYIGAKRLGL